MAFGKPKFDAKKFKMDVTTAKHRTQIVIDKKRAQAAAARKEIATLLQNPQRIESARIKSESLIRDELAVQAYELLLQFLETIVAREPIITSEAQVPGNLVEAISTVIWSVPYVEIKEFPLIRQHFVAKYGEKFVRDAASETANVNSRIIQKLTVQMPSPQQTLTTLDEICVQYRVTPPPVLADEIERMKAGPALPNGIIEPAPLPESPAFAPVPGFGVPPPMGPAAPGFGGDSVADLSARFASLDR